MANTKHVGDVATMMVASRLLQVGFPVLMPIGDNQRYDLVIDDGSGFKRVQCKNGRLNRLKTAIEFNACSTYSHKSGTYVRKDYRGAIEYFGVFTPVLDKTYLVPVEKCGRRVGILRLVARYHGNGLMAKDYEIGRVAESGLWHSPAKTENQTVPSVQIAPLPPDFM